MADTVNNTPDAADRDALLAQLRTSEQRFRALLAQATESITVVDATGTVLYDSPSQPGRLGYPPAEVEGQNIFDFVIAADQHRTRAVFQELLAQPGASRQLEVRVRARDGAVRVLELTATNLLDDPAVRGIVLNARDVTENRQALRSLAARNAVVQILATADETAAPPRILEAVGTHLHWTVGLWLTVTDGGKVLRVTECGPGETNATLAAANRDTGYRRGKGLAGLAWEQGDVVALADVTTQPDRLGAVLAQTGQVRAAVAVPVRVGQETLAVLVFGRQEAGPVEPAELETLRVIGSSVGQFLRRRQAEQRIEANERWFRALVEQSLEYISLLDAQGRIIYESPNEPRSLGYATGELVGRNVVELIHPDDRGRAIQFMMAGMTRFGEADRIELRVRAKDGGYRALDIVARNLLHDPAVGALVLNSRDVTERRQTETALRESEERLALALQAANLGIYDWDLTTNAEVFNERLVGMLGYRLAEVNQHLSFWFDKIHPEDHPRIREAIVAHLRGQTPFYETEHRLRHKNGSWVWVLDRGRVVARAPDGQPQRVTGAHLDITERKQAEEALRESEERYRLMVEAVPVLAWRCDGEGLCVDVNERWLEYTGQTAEEVRGWGWLQALHPDDRTRTMAKVKDDVGGGMIYQTEYRVRRALDGAYRWHIARALPIKNERGDTLAWIGCGADIEDQKRTEQQLETIVVDRTEELRESELKYRTLAEQIPVVTYTANLDATATTLYVSPQIEKLLGVSPAEWLADPDSWIKMVHPADRPHVLRAVAAANHPGRMLDTEYRMIHRHGQTTWVRDRAAVVCDAHGNPAVFHGVMMDVTERKALEHQVLAISEREQRRIAQDLHDGLCQHLSGLAFVAAALQRELRERRVPLHRDADRLVKLLDDAVTQARQTAHGLFPVNLDAGGLPEALRRLAEQVRAMFRVRCRWHCPQVIEVRDQTTATHLYRIAQEAAANAVRHGQPTQITISLTREAEQLCLTVRDNGRGLPPQPRPTDGMGLAVMHHRAAVIGAELTVENVRPRGVRVTCRRPIPGDAA